jgi:hypothetical protein
MSSQFYLKRYKPALCPSGDLKTFSGDIFRSRFFLGNKEHVILSYFPSCYNPVISWRAISTLAVRFTGVL